MTTDAGVHEADVARDRARRRLRHGRHARASPRAATSSTPWPAPSGCAEIIPTFSEGHARDRRLRRAVQVPAGAERVRAAARRRAARARRARRLPDLVRDPAGDARCRRRRRRRRRWSRSSPSAASSSSPAPRRPRSTRSAASSCSTTAASSPSTSSSACPSIARPTSSSSSGMTEDGYIPVDPATLRDALPGRLRGRRRRHRGRAEGRGLRGGRRARRRRDADRRARAAASRPAPYAGAAPVTSSSAAAGSAASTSTSSPAPTPTGTFNPPSAELVAEKERLRLQPPRTLVRRLRRVGGLSSGRSDLNRGPHRPERCALPGCATPRGARQYSRAAGSAEPARSRPRPPRGWGRPRAPRCRRPR